MLIESIIFSHILLCNLLTVILRPNFEEPLDTAKQLVEQNITLYMPYVEGWREFMLESNNPEYRILAENMIAGNVTKVIQRRKTFICTNGD